MYNQQTREVPVWSCVSQCSYYTDTFQLTPMPKLNLSPKWPWQWIIPLKNNSAEQWLCYSLTAHRGIVSKTHAAVTEPGSWESPQCMEDVDTLQQIQWGPQWWWRGWNIYHMSRSWEVGLASLGKRGLSRILWMFNYLLGREQRAHSQALLLGTQGQDQRH